MHLLGFAHEPPIQRKKRVGDALKRTDPIAFQDSMSGQRGHDYDGYMLLGSQSKFADNVKYRSKSAERPPRKIKKQSLVSETCFCDIQHAYSRK